jgi:serine/threonine protein kinase
MSWPPIRRRWSGCVAKQRMIGALNHAGICTLYQLGEASGRAFLVMEFLEGESLRERMARKALAEDELFEIAVQVAEALPLASSLWQKSHTTRFAGRVEDGRGC